MAPWPKNEKYRESVLLFVMGKKYVESFKSTAYIHLNNDIISGKTNFLSYHRSYPSQVKSTIILTKFTDVFSKFLFFKQAFLVLQQNNISTRLKNVQTISYMGNRKSLLNATTNRSHHPDLDLSIYINESYMSIS